jgi:hypothetical protein
MRPEQITCRSPALELPFWWSRPCCRVRRWREAADTAAADTAAVVTVAVVTAVADISAVVMAEGMALAACISAVATTPVQGSPSHIHFLEVAFTAAILLPVMAGETSARYETPRCDPEASAAL